jgi:hypothetical protein
VNQTMPATAEALRSLFRAEGFRPGVPAHLPAEALAVDLNCFRRMRCPQCRKSVAVRPWTDGARHRLLCSCRCGYATEA